MIVEVHMKYCMLTPILLKYDAYDLSMSLQNGSLLVRKVVGSNPDHAEVQPVANFPLEKAAFQYKIFI